MAEKCEARIATDRAQRYLEQLCGHLGRMHHMSHAPSARVEQTSDTSAVVTFADGAWVLEAGPDALTLRIEADDPAALERLKDALGKRIATIGRRDNLSVEWLR